MFCKGMVAFCQLLTVDIFTAKILFHAPKYIPKALRQADARQADGLRNGEL